MRSGGVSVWNAHATATVGWALSPAISSAVQVSRAECDRMASSVSGKASSTRIWYAAM